MIRRLALVGLFGFLGLWSACSDTVQLAPPSSDIDRQCTPAEGCKDQLLCVRLFCLHLPDGGESFTCHPPCTQDMDCPMGYSCYLTELKGMMARVCVRKDVLNNYMDVDACM